MDLTATLYLPPGYVRERDGPLPCLLWAYPREFKSKVILMPWSYNLSPSVLNALLPRPVGSLLEREPCI